ncbi:L-arabinose ABC transporter permease AraH [Photobacterium sp. Hal280]|uniref:L-arabinose ABC transporter permease AraH n=1 Tax=Photobacterium sp. Hal280 TaxID=3035163 RepID=UPI00301D6F12
MATSSTTKLMESDNTSTALNMSAVWDKYGMLMVFAGLFLLCAFFVPYFATLVNIKGLGLAISMSGMVACAMLFCLACGDLDLSVASVIACSGVVTAVAINATGSVVLGVGAGLLSGVLFGLLNGFVIAKLQVNALITTLATMQIARGLGYIISDGKAVGITEESFFALGNSSLFGIPTPVWLTLITFAVFAFLLNRTVYGRNTLAIGGNEEAARLAGVNVVKTKMIIFTVSGFISALAGVILAARMTSGQPMTSVGFELVVISACVLGGVSLKGGIGKVSYVIAGVLILGTVENAMNLLNMSPFAQYVVRGSILLAAVIFDRYKQTSRKA